MAVALYPWWIHACRQDGEPHVNANQGGHWNSMLLGVVGKSGGRTADGRKFTVGPTQCWGRVVCVLVDRAAASIHKEVDDSRHLQAELFSNCRLDLLAGTFDLAEDRHQGAPLDLGEHHARLLGWDGWTWLGAWHIMTPLSTWQHTSIIVQTAAVLRFLAHIHSGHHQQQQQS